jgi:hypothetical protein
MLWPIQVPKDKNIYKPGGAPKGYKMAQNEHQLYCTLNISMNPGWITPSESV